MMHVLGHVPLKMSQNFITTSLIPFFCDFVMLFMIVSDFSLSCGYYKRFKSGNISMNDFYKKRYNRFLPFFAFLCVVDLLVSPSIGSLYEFFCQYNPMFRIFTELWGHYGYWCRMVSGNYLCVLYALSFFCVLDGQ